MSWFRMRLGGPTVDTPKLETPAASEATPLNPDSDLLALSDTSVRHGFVQKVYGILSFQLMTTAVIAGLIYHYCQSWTTSYWTATLASFLVGLVLLIGVIVIVLLFPETMSRAPLNYIMLAIFTIGESVFVGFISLQYTKESILIALAITALIVGSLTIFACQTTYDFTGIGPYLFVGLMCVSGVFLVLIIFYCLGLQDSAFNKLLVALGAAGAFFFSMYIVYDTQLIIGGKGKSHQFSIDDYCKAAITIYVDITELFIMILQCVGDRR